MSDRSASNRKTVLTARLPPLDCLLYSDCRSSYAAMFGILSLFWFIPGLGLQVSRDSWDTWQLQALRGNPSQRYGASPAICGHTVLSATGHGWTCPAL